MQRDFTGHSRHNPAFSIQAEAVYGAQIAGIERAEPDLAAVGGPKQLRVLRLRDLAGNDAEILALPGTVDRHNPYAAALVVHAKSHTPAVRRNAQAIRGPFRF